MNRRDQNPAERFLMSIFVRLIGCGYLIYTIVKLLTAPAEERPQTWVTTLIVVILIILSAVIITMTLHEFITGLKTGRYKRSTYAHLTQTESAPETPEEAGTPGDAPLLTDDEAAPGETSEEAREDGASKESGPPEEPEVK